MKIKNNNERRNKKIKEEEKEEEGRRSHFHTCMLHRAQFSVRKYFVPLHNSAVLHKHEYISR